jgi:predicted transposase/invertase (TIGR01784 family)
MQFVDVKNDIAFRKIFGNENKKVILISFLNAVLELEGRARIVHIDMVNPFQLPIVKNLKASVVDLRVRDGNGNPYVIEMQVAEQDGLDKRLQYYMGKEYAQQINSGVDYPLLKPVIFIGIFDFDFTPAPYKYLSHHAFCDVDNGDRVLKDMDFFFVELRKFHKTLPELETIQDKWIFFIKEAKNLEFVPENLGDEGLVEAYHDAAKFNWTKEEMWEYDQAAMREQDLRGQKALAVRRAAELAKAEGKAEGNDEAEGRIVHFQASKGKTVEEISANTGLPLERVNELLAKDRG